MSGSRRGADPRLAGMAEAAAVAYDALAADYDRATADDGWMRSLLARCYRSRLRPGARVLDLGCGTGADSFELARHGARVVALDVSVSMLAELRARPGSAVAAAVSPLAADAAGLELFRPGVFDLIVSSFAAVNTVADWPALAAGAARVLRPGGRLMLHVLGPGGPWERRVADGWRTVEIAGRPVRHRVRPPATAIADFVPPFHLRRVCALGFLWPRRWGSRLPPALARAGGRLELLLGGLAPLRGRGRFYLLELERGGDTGAGG